MMKPTKPHAALAVLDEAISKVEANRGAHQAEAERFSNRYIELCALRAKIEKAISAPPPKPVADKPKRTRRTKKEMEEARAKTVAAAQEAGLVSTAPSYAADKAAAVRRGDAEFDVDDFPPMPENLKR